VADFADGNDGWRAQAEPSKAPAACQASSLKREPTQRGIDPVTSPCCSTLALVGFLDS
jgi:hypothetical protein